MHFHNGADVWGVAVDYGLGVSVGVLELQHRNEINFLYNKDCSNCLLINFHSAWWKTMVVVQVCQDIFPRNATNRKKPLMWILYFD